MSSEWTKRAYLPSDERGVLYLWLKSYAHSAYGVARGAHIDASPEELAYWNDQAPVVEALLQHADVEVACDPDRVYDSEAGPSVIWGFACTSGDVVHMVVVKRSAHRAGIAADIVRDLLGNRLERACGMTHEQSEIRKIFGRIPRAWYMDSTWLGRALLGSRRAA